MSLTSDSSEQIYKSSLSERDYILRNIVMQSPIAMAILYGNEFIIEFANDKLLKEIWNRNISDITGKRAVEIFPEIFDQKHYQLLLKAYNNGFVHSEKGYFAQISGNEGLKSFYLDIEFSPLREPDGSIKRIILTIINVTGSEEARKITEQAEARIRIAVEKTGTATWELDLLTNTFEHSPRLAEMFGYKKNQKLSLGQLKERIIENDQALIVEPAFQNALMSGESSYEARIIHPDKSVHWIYTNGVTVYDANNIPVRMLGTVNDITERKEHEIKLLQLASIVESSDDAIISKTIHGIVTSFNNAAERLFGYKASEIIGQSIAVLFPEGYEDEEPKILARLRKGEKVEHFETIRKHKSGRLINVSLTISPLKDNKGNIIGASKIARDITFQKQAEKQLKETKEQLQVVIEASELGTWELNVQTGEIVTSPKYLKITGGDYFKNPTHEQLKSLLYPDDLPIREQAFIDAFKTGKLHYETRLVWPDKSIHWVEANGKVFYDEYDKPLKLIGTVRDITEERSYQQKLTSSEERFRNVANTVPVMIWMVGVDMKYTFLNNSWLEFTQITLEEENEDVFTKGLHPDDYDRVVPPYIKAFNAREPFYFEYRLRRYDGTYRWISDNGTPQFNHKGDFEGYIGACMDINDRIEFEQKLKESESRLRIAALSSELGTWTLYPQTQELIWDNASRQLFGINDTTPMTLELFWKSVHIDDHEQTLTKMKRALDPAIADLYDAEYRVAGLPENEVRWIHAKGKAQFNENNEPYIFAGTVLDITAKKIALDELQESELKFRVLADSMPQMIWIGDRDGNLNYFNKSVYDYSGKSPEQIESEGWLEIVHPDDRATNVHEWLNAVKTGTPFLLEHRFRRFDGQYRWQLSRAIPQRDSEGNILQWVGTSTDIHEQKTFVEKLEEQVKLRTHELNKVNEELLKSNDELAQFAYVASHDLQEPLRKIQTFSNRIAESEVNKLSERGQDYFNRIQATSQRMQQLIIDLLTFSRANTAEKRFETMDINQILHLVKDQLRETINAKQAVITADKLPLANVVSFQFEQLLTNIFSNALKFTKPDVTPHIHVAYQLASGKNIGFIQAEIAINYHHFSIKDNGIGFSNDYRERIFQVFQRLHGRDKYEGTGIGLAIVKKIVENHSGFINAEGKENEGAEFNIYIPVDIG